MLVSKRRRLQYLLTEFIICIFCALPPSHHVLYNLLKQEEYQLALYYRCKKKRCRISNAEATKTAILSFNNNFSITEPYYPLNFVARDTAVQKLLSLRFNFFLSQYQSPLLSYIYIMHIKLCIAKFPPELGITSMPTVT